VNTDAVRVQVLLARAGLGSRRSLEDAIASGRVRINGEVARLGAKARPGVDRVELDGVEVATEEGLEYWLLNKPRGVISSVSDPHGRPTVRRLVPTAARVYPVGRLDADSEGLLLLTNDGVLTFQLTHPRFHVPKEYLVWTDRDVGRGIAARVREGVDEGGELLRAERVGVLGPRELRIVLVEGRNRQIRRMLGALGVGVERLVRVRIGPLRDPRLPPGIARPLSRQELARLHRAIAANLVPHDAQGAAGRYDPG